MARFVLSLLIMTHNNELRIVSPKSKHIGTFGIPSLIGHSYDLLNSNFPILICFCSLDEGFKTSSYLTETLLDPELGHAYEPNKAAFNRAHNVKEDMWSWFEHPDNRLRLARFGAAMSGLKNALPANAILDGLVLLLCINCIPLKCRIL